MFLSCGMIFLLANMGFAERKYVLGTSVDFMGGVGNDTQGNINLQQLGEDVAPFFSVYPSVSLSSTGQHSTLKLDYTFIAEHYFTTDGLTTTSHAVTGSFNSQLSRTVRLRIWDTFDTAPSYSTINVLQGFTYTPGGFQYVFEPQLYKSSSISNTGNVAVDVDLSSKSFLTFGASGAFLSYDEAVSGSSLSDQSRVEGNITYSHKQSKRLTWNLKYAFRQNDYDKYDSTRTHTPTFGLMAELSPSMNLTLEAGPAFIKDEYVSYVINANISKQFEANRFMAGYSHYAGDSTGLGGSTESHQGYLGFSRTLGRAWSISFFASAFRQSQRDSTIYDYWGVDGSAGLSRMFGKHWVASVGASYMTYLGQTGGQNDYAYKQVYGSIGFRFPELWKGQK
jgi:hypothetical protein